MRYHRKTFVPTTVPRIRDVVKILNEVSAETIPTREFVDRLVETGTSQRRAHELKNSAKQLGLVEEQDGSLIVQDCFRTDQGDSLDLAELLELLNRVIGAMGERRLNFWRTRSRLREGGSTLHAFFLNHLLHYKKLVDILEDNKDNMRGLTRDEIETISLQLSEAEGPGDQVWLNKVTDKLGDIGEYCGTISFNLFFWSEEQVSRRTHKLEEYSQQRYYLLDADGPYDSRTFQAYLDRRYFELLSEFSPYGSLVGYLEVPLLREFVCEELGMHKEDFDAQLINLWERNLGDYSFARSTRVGEKYASVAAIMQLEDASGRMKSKLGASSVRARKLMPIVIDGEDFFYIQITK